MSGSERQRRPQYEQPQGGPVKGFRGLGAPMAIKLVRSLGIDGSGATTQPGFKGTVREVRQKRP